MDVATYFLSKNKKLFYATWTVHKYMYQFIAYKFFVPKSLHVFLQNLVREETKEDEENDKENEV